MVGGMLILIKLLYFFGIIDILAPLIDIFFKIFDDMKYLILLMIMFGSALGLATPKCRCSDAHQTDHCQALVNSG